jgi:RNA 2',3'-cyclic 3'-phosphodiesterase
MKATVRTFVAVEIEEPIRHAAATLIEELRKVSAEVGWAAPHNMHLTVKFLGDVAAEKIPEVCQTVAQAVAEIEAFDLEIRGVGAFPNAGRPRTIWLGSGDGEAQLAELAKRVEKALSQLGFPREGRPFRGHLTLGRVRRPGPGLAALAPMLKQRADLEIGRSHVGEVVVFSSQLQRGGSVYDALSRTPLSGVR